MISLLDHKSWIMIIHWKKKRKLEVLQPWMKGNFPIVFPALQLDWTCFGGSTSHHHLWSWKLWRKRWMKLSNLVLCEIFLYCYDSYIAPTDQARTWSLAWWQRNRRRIETSVQKESLPVLSPLTSGNRTSPSPTKFHLIDMHFHLLWSTFSSADDKALSCQCPCLWFSSFFTQHDDSYAQAILATMKNYGNFAYEVPYQRQGAVKKTKISFTVCDLTIASIKVGGENEAPQWWRKTNITFLSNVIN